MIIKQMSLGMMQTNCYIVIDEKSRQGIIIDPGSEPEKVMNAIEQGGWNIQYIFLTHGHFDHIGAVEYIKDKLKAPVVVHEIENEYLQDIDLNLSGMFGREKITVEAQRLVQENDEVIVGNMKFRIFHIPGHTAGSVCYYEPEEKVLFSGDTLFQGAIGRTDLPKGDFHALTTSIKEKLFALPEEVEVYSGHGEKTTIGIEKKSNSYLSDQGWD